jgi:hypothetical protein
MMSQPLSYYLPHLKEIALEHGLRLHYVKEFTIARKLLLIRFYNGCE